LEEIAVENRDRFRAAGGEHYGYIAALNDRTEHVSLIAQLIRERCTHWPEFSAAAMQDEAASRALVVERQRKLSAKD
ncbi:MAG: ferrochelatase, partial [Rhodanobacteraceae bacterium]|nr:ferrochelatase [Rhodanobacteraceae bacterium]